MILKPYLTEKNLNFCHSHHRLRASPYFFYLKALPNILLTVVIFNKWLPTCTYYAIQFCSKALVFNLLVKGRCLHKWVPGGILGVGEGKGTGWGGGGGEEGAIVALNRDPSFNEKPIWCSTSRNIVISQSQETTHDSSFLPLAILSSANHKKLHMILVFYLTWSYNAIKYHHSYNASCYLNYKKKKRLSSSTLQLKLKRANRL